MSQNKNKTKQNKNKKNKETEEKEKEKKRKRKRRGRGSTDFKLGYSSVVEYLPNVYMTLGSVSPALVGRGGRSGTHV